MFIRKSLVKISVLIALASFVALLSTGCTQTDQDTALSKTNKAEETKPDYDISIWPSIDFSATYDPEIEAKIADLLSQMTLEQKVAQMIQPEIRDFTVQDMQRYGFGSYLNGGGSFPFNNKHATPEDWIKLAEDMYQASVDDSLDGSSIPTMWGTDAVHGHNNVIGATLFPHNIGLGAANNPALIEQIAQVTAREVIATGIDWVFAPTVAVVRNDRWGRTYEGYSEDPEIVRNYSAAIVKGLQGSIGEGFLNDTRVLATIKHFVGDGGTKDGIDQGDNISDESTLFSIHAQGYVGGLSAGAQTVMASFNSWHGKKMHGHQYLLTEVLKNKIGFDGFVLGDWLGHGQIKGCTNYDCATAINAGLDVFMASGDAWKPLMEKTIEQVKNGEISESRINDAVSRVLRVKLRAGLFDKPSPANRSLSGKTSLIGATEHRDLARQAVRESLVLLKNNNKVLPIKPTQTIMVSGDGANDIGKQSGGWTITWQGTNNTNEDFPGGSSIYDGIANSVAKAGGTAFLSVDGSFDKKPDVAIVVFGEDPYAEGVGDLKNLSYQEGSKTDLAIIEKLKSQGIPVVSVFISGRPLYMNAELNASDAFVAAWLPGSEGRAVSEVLLSDANGKIQNDFKGRLAYSWPASPYQTEVNKGDDNYKPLLPYGYGLSYTGDSSQTIALDSLPVETIDTAQISNLSFFKKSLPPSYSAFVSSQDQNLEIANNIAEVEGLKVRSIDKNLQDDARQLTFSGTPSSTFSIKSESTLDLTEQRKQELSLFINLRVESPVKNSVLLSMQCNDNCENSIDISNELKKLALNEWNEINISIACFEKAGASLNDITAPFAISSHDELTLSFSEISVRSTPNVDQCE